MASSSEKSVKLPEKPSFSQKCSLLSQYLRERGSFPDLSRGMTCNIEANGTSEMPRRPTTTTTMNLFPIIEKSDDVSARNTATPMNLFPQQAGFASKKDTPDMVDLSVNKSAAVEPQTAQMTIFYGGQVIVFNDFPADKAKEIMLLASKGSSQSQSTNSFASKLTKTPIESSSSITPALVKNSTEPSCSVPSTSNVIPNFGNNLVPEHVQPQPRAGTSVPSTSNVIPNFGNNLVPEHVQPQPRAGTCDLPIARRNSLHRFLEKRKDRITTRAPYQSSTSNKPAESKSWLGLAAQSPQ